MKPMIEIYWHEEENTIFVSEINEVETYTLAYVLINEEFETPWLYYGREYLTKYYGWQKIGEL